MLFGEVKVGALEAGRSWWRDGKVVVDGWEGCGGGMGRLWWRDVPSPEQLHVFPAAIAFFLPEGDVLVNVE